MLILTRKPGESLYIGDVKVTIVGQKGNQIRIGIEAPQDVRIYREEIMLQILEENKKAAEAAPASGSGLEGLPGNWKGKDGEEKKPGVAGLRAFPSQAPTTTRVVTQGEEGQQVIFKKKRKKSDE